MTATQLFFMFLKEECTINEMRFFKQTILSNHGNKYFIKKPLYTKTFVEDYLSRNNRPLSNFMTRLFILAPNLKKLCDMNPRYNILRNEFRKRNEGKTYVIYPKYWEGPIQYGRRVPVTWFRERGVATYINYYRKKWNEFLKNKVYSPNKKMRSPFKIGETYDFKLIDEMS